MDIGSEERVGQIANLADFSTRELTLLQKRKEVRFEFPATFPEPYEPPGSGLSGNINF